MRRLRARFVVGSLLVLALIMGLVFWGRQAIHARLTPTIAEQNALAHYKQANLTREVAEYAIREYQDGTFQQTNLEAKNALDQAQRDRDLDRLRWSSRTATVLPDSMPTLRWRQSPYRVNPEFDPGPDPPNPEPTRPSSRNQFLQSLQQDLIQAQTNEAASQARYEQERAKRQRRWWFGF